MYDAIIVGARCAGSASALLLARMGYKVLLVDKAEFPSDTISSHQLQVPGGAFLKGWGLLDKLAAAGTPLAHTVTFDTGSVVLHGAFPDMGGVTGVHSPRRRILDTILLNAAREAGADVRTHFDVDELLHDGDRVTGIMGHTPHGSPVTEQGRIVIGADGKHSMVARAANAPTYNERPTLTCAYYTYWEGVPVTGGEMYTRQGHAIGVWPTNDGQVITYLGLPRDRFDAFRANVDENFMKEIAVVPQLAERLRAGKRADRIYGTGDNPNFFHKPYGPGWALAGDAGYNKDPITGLGMSDAFRDADLLTAALNSAWSGQQTLDTALASYEQQRNKASMPAYEFTCQLASFAPPAPEQQALLSALANNPEQTDRFFGVITGSVPYGDYFSPANMRRILGFKGLAKIALQKISQRGGPAARPTQVEASAR